MSKIWGLNNDSEIIFVVENEGMVGVDAEESYWEEKMKSVMVFGIIVEGIQYFVIKRGMILKWKTIFMKNDVP